MIVAAKTDQDRSAMFTFLRMAGAHLHRSEDFQAIGHVDYRNKLIGVVGFNGFCGKTAQVHIAGTGNWVTREFIRQVFHYAFIQVKLNWLIGIVNASNERALHFDQRMGFKIWLTIPNGADDGEDLIILKMAREDCKWIKADPFRKAA